MYCGGNWELIGIIVPQSKYLRSKTEEAGGGAGKTQETCAFLASQKMEDNNNKFIYFNCACTKLIQTHDSLDKPGATIPGAFARGIMLTG
jgi:hypothetical protein